MNTPAAASAESVVLDSLWTIGVLAGRPEQEFGKIIGAALDRDQNVYLLDAATQSVRVFDRSGAFIRSVGGPGRGPGEMSMPQAILHDGVETLYILDAENGLILFRTSSGEVEYDRTLRLGIRATDFCISDQRIYAFGLQDGHTIHEFGRDGRAIRSFGDRFGPRDSQLAQEVVSGRGKIACFPQHQIVVAASALLPEVRAYRTTDGKLLWSDSLPNFVPIVIRASGGRYTMMPRREGYAENTVLRRLDSEILLAQSRRAVTNTQSSEVISSCLLVVQTGACAMTSQSLPLVLTTADARAITLREKLFPIVTFARVQRVKTAAGEALP